MTIYYLDNDDFSGVFSTYEKALASALNCAKTMNCDMTAIPQDGWVQIHYTWPEMNEEAFAYITELILDKDYVIED